MTFKKNKYAIIKQAISSDMSEFIFNYFLMKKQVYDSLLKYNYMSPYEDIMNLKGIKIDLVVKYLLQ